MNLVGGNIHNIGGNIHNAPFYPIKERYVYYLLPNS